MIFYTGEIHGNNTDIIEFCKMHELTDTDVVVLLGDVGANYYTGKRDRKMKEAFAKVAPTFLCIHGNHEMRPETIDTYKQRVWNGGIVWYEEDFPNLLFAKDGEIYEIEGIRHIAIGGAYSVDKYYRITRGYGWWADEQPSEETKAYVEKQLAMNEVDVILSHTCPYKYEPREMFLSFIDQDTVDDSTERWLDEIEGKTDYKAWYCGHWHTDKRIDKMHFLYHTIETAKHK